MAEHGKPGGLPATFFGLSRRQALALAAILILALGLRIYGIGDRIEAPDENMTLRAMGDIGNLYSQLAEEDFHPPLYYLLISPAYLIMPGLVSIRLVGALLGALTVLAVFFLAREFMDARKSLIAAFLFAIYPYSIVYSQQARCYVLVILLSTLSTLVWVRFLKGKGSPILLVPLYAATAYTDYTAVFGIAVQAAITLLLKFRTPEAKKYFGALALSAILCLPLCFLLAEQRAIGVAAVKWGSGVDAHIVLDYLRQGIGTEYGLYFNSQLGITGRPIPQLFLPAVAAWVLAFIGISMLWRRRADFYALAALYLLASLLVFFAGLVLSYPPQHRFILFLTPLLILFIAEGTDFRSIVRTTLFFIVLFGWCLAVLFYYSHLLDLHYIGLP
ncbi:MAG: glycosyltransferase family 39 protein [Candidatus Diapherotrites archaeon]